MKSINRLCNTMWYQLSFITLYINAASIKNNFDKKDKLHVKKLSQMDEKRLKTYPYAPFSQEHFAKSKIHSLKAAPDQETFLP